MGRSDICINFNAMEQMWIDKGKIDTFKTFMRRTVCRNGGKTVAPYSWNLFLITYCFFVVFGSRLGIDNF